MSSPNPTVTSLHVHGVVQVGETVVGGITAVNNPVETTIREESTSGELATRIQAIVAQKFSPSFTTMDVATALGACGSLGALLATNPLTLFGRARNQDLSVAGSGHTSYLYQNGLLIPTTLSAAHQGDASLSYSAVVTSDGLNAPLVISDSGVTIPELDHDERWALASATINGTPIPQLVNVSVAFGIQAGSEGADSDVYDSRTFVSAVSPKIDVTSTRISALLDLLGTDGAIAVVLRKRVDGGTFDATTLTLSGTGLATFTDPFNGSGPRRGQMTLRANLKYDGNSAPLGLTLGGGGSPS
jgi:hypothetical protein